MWELDRKAAFSSLLSFFFFFFQVLEGSSLFSQDLSLKARGLPMQYKKATPQPTSTFTPSNSNRGGQFDRFDNSSLRGGFSFNKSNTWHGQKNSFTPRGRGGYNRGGYNNYNNNHNYQNQVNIGTKTFMLYLSMDFYLFRIEIKYVAPSAP